MQVGSAISSGNRAALDTTADAANYAKQAATDTANAAGRAVASGKQAAVATTEEASQAASDTVSNAVAGVGATGQWIADVARKVVGSMPSRPQPHLVTFQNDAPLPACHVVAFTVGVTVH